MNKEINIFEYSKSIEQLEGNQEEIHNYFQNLKTIAPAVVQYDSHLKNESSWVGIITTHNHIINFKSKLDKKNTDEVATSNLFYMISYLNNIEKLVLDTKHYSKIKEGKFFFDVLAKIFVCEFQKIFKRGLLKKYVKYREKTGFLKGKLQLKLQANQIVQNKFNCEFDDLTHNNIENQSIMLTADILSKLVKNPHLKLELKKIVSLLEDEILLNKNITRNDLRKIKFNRLNNHYKYILQVCEYVITKKFISSIHQTSDYNCCNFLVDMNQVYEDFVTKLFTEIIGEEEFSSFDILSQHSNNTLVKKGRKFNTKPDLLISENGEIRYILDIKYKSEKVRSGDFYQICAYSLAYPNVKQAFLLYEQLDETQNSSTISKNIEKDSLVNGEVDINFIPLQLKTELSQTFDDKEEFKKEVKFRLRNKLKKILYSNCKKT